jgi:hypothetical protein
METLIIHLDSKDSKAKLREALKMFRGVTGVSDKLTISDIEELADDALIKEIKKADKTPLLTFEEGKIEFERIKKRLPK